MPVHPLGVVALGAVFSSPLANSILGPAPGTDTLPLLAAVPGTYDGGEPAPGDDSSTDVALRQVYTTVQHPVSETRARALQADMRRVVRQRFAHVQFCVDTVDMAESVNDFDASVQVDAHGEVTVQSHDLPEFAACLTPLATLWPLPADVRGSRTHLSLRVDVEEVSPAR